MKLVVIGGRGFIGSNICRIAAETGHQVVSVAPHGRPDQTAAWTYWVHWRQADVFDLAAWEDDLADCDAVIDCVGTAMEDPQSGITFERFNEDSALVAAEAAQRAGVPKFVYLSASVKPPLVSERYLNTKRRAEARLRAMRGLRTAILRLPLVYGPDRPISMPAGWLLQGLSELPLLGREADAHRPMPVSHVAAAALQAALTPGERGVYDADEVQLLAESFHPAYLRDPRPGLLALAAVGVTIGLGIGLWRTRR